MYVAPEEKYFLPEKLEQYLSAMMSSGSQLNYY
jgi:hypothetical protein